MASPLVSPRRLLVGLLLIAGLYGWWVLSQYQRLSALNQRELADAALELKSAVETAFENISNYAPEGKPLHPACDFDVDQPYLELTRCEAEHTVWKNPRLRLSDGIQIEADRFPADHKLPNAEIVFAFRTDVLLDELPFTGRFERVLVVDGDGQVVFQEDPTQRNRLQFMRWGERRFRDANAGKTRGVRVQSVTDLLGKDATPDWGRLRSVTDRTMVQLGGSRYHLYTQPLGIEDPKGAQLVMVAAVPVAAMLQQALAFDTYLFALLVLLALVGMLGFPFIKLATLHPHERFTIRDVRWLYVSCAALVVVATFAIMAVDGYDRWTDAADRGLRQLSADIERQMLAEIDEIRNALERHDEAAFKLTPGPKCSSMDVLSKWFEKPEAPNKLGFPIDDNIYLHQVAWIGPNGKQIWKITSDSIGKKVSVPHRAYFKAVRDGGLFETHPDGPGFFLGPDRSITDGKFYTFLSIRSRLTDQQCESRARPQREDPYVAVATARLLSLDRMPLPAGYAFVVLNREGRVLYHSDGRLSLRENFFDQLNDGDAARSIVLGGGSELIATGYREVPHRVLFSRLSLRHQNSSDSSSGPVPDSTGLYLATFRDVSIERAVISRTFVLSLLGPFPFLVAMILAGIWAAGYLSQRIGHGRDNWLWPNGAFHQLYRRQAIVYGTILGASVVFARLGAGTWAYVALPVVTSIGGLAAYGLYAAQQPPRQTLEQPYWHRLQFVLLALGIAFVPAAAMFDTTMRHEFATLIDTEQRWIGSQIDDARLEMEADARAEGFPASIGTRAAAARMRRLGSWPEPFDAGLDSLSEANASFITLHQWFDHLVPFKNQQIERFRYQDADSQYTPPGLFGLSVAWSGVLGMVILAAGFVTWLRWTSTHLLYANVESATEELEPRVVDAQWEQLGSDERYALMQIDREGIANPRQREQVSGLVKLGLLRLDPNLQLSSDRLRRLVQRARGGEATNRALKEWEDVDVHDGRNWHDTRSMLIVSLGVVAVLVATQPGLPAELAGVAAGITTVGGAGLKLRDMFADWLEKTPKS